MRAYLQKKGKGEEEVIRRLVGPETRDTSTPKSIKAY